MKKSIVMKRKRITDPELLREFINEIIRHSNNEKRAFIKKNRDVVEFVLSCDNKTYKSIWNNLNKQP
jgi:hypothetical protein